MRPAARRSPTGRIGFTPFEDNRALEDAPWGFPAVPVSREFPLRVSAGRTYRFLVLADPVRVPFPEGGIRYRFRLGPVTP